jgi:hypothetical protein
MILLCSNCGNSIDINNNNNTSLCQDCINRIKAPIIKKEKVAHLVLAKQKAQICEYCSNNESESVLVRGIRFYRPIEKKTKYRNLCTNCHNSYKVLKERCTLINIDNNGNKIYEYHLYY